MSGKVRGVRFSQEEEALIEEFLEKNKMLDFSTMAKVAILDFIRQPRINLIPVGQRSGKEVRNARPTP